MERFVIVYSTPDAPKREIRSYVDSLKDVICVLCVLHNLGANLLHIIPFDAE